MNTGIAGLACDTRSKKACRRGVFLQLPATTFTYNQHCHMYLPQTHIYHHLHMGTCMLRSCAHVQVVLLLPPVPTCADGCWCPVPLTFSNLLWWCFPFQQLAQTLSLHLLWLPCAGGLFLSSTCAFTACTYCNLHCGGGSGGIYIIIMVHSIK